MIGIISQNLWFRQVLSRAFSALGYREIILLQPELSTLETQIKHAALLVLDAHLAFSTPLGESNASSWANRLRSCYGGAILVLAFVPRAGVRTWLGLELVDIPGCTFGQLPLMLAELRCLLDAATPLTPSERNHISRISQCKELAAHASKLGHAYENAFSQALSALWELEKYGGFLDPDTQRMHREIQAIHGRLTEERLSMFFMDLRTLSVKATSLSLLDETTYPIEQLDSQSAKVAQWLPLVNLSDGTGKSNEICQAAHEIRSILRECLTSFRVIKENATKEIEGGS